MGGFHCFENGAWDHHPEVHRAYEQKETTVYQDMTQPLSHYFISSGHNSYLTGNQLSSKGGTETIVYCLQHGCRVIELDVYNGDEDGPKCKHGGTMTKSVTLRECVQAIKRYAFTASPYPVIITLENHTTGENQKIVADIIRHELGDLLFVPPWAEEEKEARARKASEAVPTAGTGAEAQGGDEAGAKKLGKERSAHAEKGWRSPEELKGKILIRTSVKESLTPDLKDIIYIENFKFKGFAALKDHEVPVSASVGEKKAFAVIERVLPKSKEIKSLLGSPMGSHSGASGQKKSIDVQAAVEAAGGIDPDGSDEDPDTPEGVQSAETSCSLQDLWSHTTKHLVRVYPGGWRVASNNYDPTDVWNLGASLAALNWQKWDKPLWINQGKFLDNGGCGYVLKPEWMRNPPPLSDLIGSSGQELPGGLMNLVRELREKPSTLRVHVYSAFRHQGWSMLCYKDDIFVEIEIKGMVCDKQKHQTNRVHNTGRLLVDASYDLQVFFPELAVLLLHLKDHDTGAFGDTCGYFALPLATLKPGEYKLPLYKTNGKQPSMREMWIKVAFSWVETKLNPVGSTVPLLAAS